jgi:hypothetical protein
MTMLDRIGLARYADDLAAERDRYLAQAQASAPAGDGYAVGLAAGTSAGFRLALSILHTATAGEYGLRLDDQPNPFARQDDRP